MRSAGSGGGSTGGEGVARQPAGFEGGSVRKNEIMDKGATPERRAPRPRPVHTFEKHYTINAACELLSISRSTIYEWIKDGYFSYTVQTPGGQRIPASVLDEFVKSRRIVCRR